MLVPLGGDGTIPARLLGLVERLVDPSIPVPERFVTNMLGNSQAGRADTNFRQGIRFNGLANFFRHSLGALQISPWQQNDKFFATKANDKIGFAD